MKHFLPANISKHQAKDSGLAIILVLLFIGVILADLFYVKIAIIVLILVMIIPQIFKYFAVFWFGLAHLLGTFVSKIILSLIFFLIVTPVGLFRRLLGYDSLKLKVFKKGRASVMQVRNINFVKNDIDKPF